ncbi:MAG: PHP domain-containing protein, partial [Selenomonadaceae bacterium]|nr:PHP domain-containing protein [Selenomonadaceae bacterium]
MDKYRLTIEDDKNFFRLFEEINLNFNDSTLKEIVITPEINLWQITLVTAKDFDEQILRTAEEFLRRRYMVNVEINGKPTIGTEPAPENKPSARQNGNAPRSAGSKKFSDTITKIGDITEDSGAVTIIGEVGSGEKNGVNLRECKNGTVCVSFCVTDDTDGIACKKFFKDDKKSDAQPFVDTLKEGNLVKIVANPKYDDYAKEVILFVNAIENVDKTVRTDNAEVKRVELHVHTTMSAMDAVIPVEKLIKTAADWNWNAVAITDHGV